MRLLSRIKASLSVDVRIISRPLARLIMMAVLWGSSPVDLK
jgi:hypothetical protein